MSHRPDPFTNDGSEYTRQEFIDYYGAVKGAQAWEGAAYKVGMKVRALVKLEGEQRGQVVFQGDVGEVTALPGRNSNIDAGAVAEVLINGVRFDAQPGMIEPAQKAGGGGGAPAANYRGDRPAYNNDRAARPAQNFGNDYNRGAPRDERRRDPNDPAGTMYTFKEFEQYYGRDAGAIWTRAGRVGGAPRAPRADADRRRDPNEPKSRKTYTRAEFIQEYGEKKGAALWRQAGDAAPRAESGPERRRDPNEPKSKKTYTRAEFIAEYGEKKGQQVWRQAGEQSGVAKRESGPEKRRDPNEPKSKKTYTRAEFIAEYGEKKGQKVWKDAAPKDAPKKDDAPEKRRDPNEPKSKKTYTKKEFIAEYGEKKGLKVWKDAAPKDAPKKDDAPEKRRDPNEPKSKKTYTKAEFLAEYGEKKGLKVWKDAAPKKDDAPEKRRDPNEPKSKKTYTKAEFLAEYGEKKGLKVWKDAAPKDAPKDEKKGKKEKVEDRAVEVTIEKIDGSIGWGRDGCIVLEVDADSAAAKAGVKPNRKIIAVNGKTVGKNSIGDALKEAEATFKVSIVEVRTDKTDVNGKQFTFADFVQFYGAEEGAKMWKASKPRAKRAKKSKEGKAEAGEEAATEEKKEEKTEEAEKPAAEEPAKKEEEAKEA